VIAILLGLGSSLSWGVADFLGGVASRRGGVLAVVVLSQAAGLVVLLVLVGALRVGPPPAHEYALGMAAGALGAGGLVAFYRALAVGSMSLVAPLAALGALVPVTAGVVGGDRPHAATAAGLALAIAGAVLAGRAPGPATRRGVGLALIAAAGFGGFFVLLAPAAEHEPLWATLAARTASVPLVALVAVTAGASLRLPLQLAPAVVLAGLLDATANVSFGAASQRGLVSVVAVLGSLYPVATVALARTILGERLGRVQAAGVATALAGVALVAAGGAG
jgi:uncharacterized membrane protein